MTHVLPSKSTGQKEAFSKKPQGTDTFACFMKPPSGHRVVRHCPRRHSPNHSEEPVTRLSDLLSLWAQPGSWETMCDSSPTESTAALQQMSLSWSSDGDWERVNGSAPDQRRAGPHPQPTASPSRPEAEAPLASLLPRWTFVFCQGEQIRQVDAGGWVSRETQLLAPAVGPSLRPCVLHVGKPEPIWDHSLYLRQKRCVTTL